MLHTFPNAPEIVVAVRDWLREEVVTHPDPELAFRARVAANLLSMLERELTDAGDAEKRFTQALAGRGVADERGLALQLRRREVDPDPELLELLRATTADRLRTSNPRFLAEQVDDDDPREVDGAE